MANDTCMDRHAANRYPGSVTGLLARARPGEDTMLPHSKRTWRAIALLLFLLAAGCPTATMSPARRQRISECLKQCEARGAAPATASSDGRGSLDPRSDCERRCYEMK